MSILSPREQRERSKLMVTDTRRSEAVLNFLQDCNAVRLRESQIIRHHHNRIHIGLLTKNSLLGLYVAQRILLLIPFEVCRRNAKLLSSAQREFDAMHQLVSDG